MTNRQPDLVETSGGWQPHTSGGERLLVALAGLALLGGLLIVGSNLLKHHDEVSAASPSPAPTDQAASHSWVPSIVTQELVGADSGPAGSIMVTSVRVFGGAQGTEVWQSPYGDQWTSLGTPPTVDYERIAGSGPGYQMRATKAGF